MARKSAVLRPEIQNVFLERTGSIYSGMSTRAAHLNMPMPFTVAEMRVWLIQDIGFGPRGENAVQCCYCSQWLNVATFVLDHVIAIARPWYGGFGFDNLAACCASCNRRKGKMSAEGFRQLTAFTLTLDSRDAGDLWSRLANGGEGAKLMWKRQKGWAKPKALPGGLL